MNQLPLFDGRKARAAKARGMARAAAHHNGALGVARDIAKAIAGAYMGDGTVNMDQVAQGMMMAGFNATDLGNAAGSVFKGDEWEFTGRYVKSQRVSAHARDIKVWRLK